MDVCLLASNGNGLGAMKIARTCLESAINAEYLRLEPNEYSDFKDWHFVEQHRKLVFMRKYRPSRVAALDAKRVAGDEKIYQTVEPRFLLPNSKKRLRASWCKINLSQRAVKAKFEHAYDAAYPLSSELSHGSFGGLVQHIESIDGGGSQLAIPPSLTGCAQALQTAHYCTLRAIETLVELKGTDSTPSLAMLKDDYAHAWPEKKKKAAATA